MKLWQSYFVKKFLKLFLFSLLNCFLLYSLVEYSMHMNDFFKGHDWQVSEIFLHYLTQFLKRLDFLFPVALLLSVVHTLTILNRENQWLVLQIAGLSSRKLVHPFLIISFCCSGILYANSEYFLPHLLKKGSARVFFSSHALRGTDRQCHVLPVKDNSKIFYRLFEPKKQLFSDVFWVKNFDEIWRIKYLTVELPYPVAEFADHLMRNHQGNLEKVESFERIPIKELSFSSHEQFRVDLEELTSFSRKGIVHLYKNLDHFSKRSCYRSKILAVLTFRVCIPLISPLLIIALAPFCLIYRDRRAAVWIYGVGLFSLFTFYTLSDAMLILNGVISPTVGVILPFVCALAIWGPRFFLKCRK